MIAITRTPEAASSWNDVRYADILVVDDEATNLRLFEIFLQRAGYKRVELMSDPRKVLDRVLEREPDLILLDLTMPHLDGFELLDQLRDVVSSGTYLPIIVVSGRKDPVGMRRALASGAKDFQTKPLDYEDLLLRIGIQLETRFELMALQEEARRRDAYLRTVVDAVPNVMFARDAEGRFRMANQATAQIMGTTLEAIQGRIHREVTPRPDAVARFEEELAMVFETGQARVGENSCRDLVTGDLLWFETRIVPLVPPDGSLQALVVSTDHTARRRAEEALVVSQHETLTRLSHAAEYRDDDTGMHTRRVGKLASEIARLLGYPEREQEVIRQAAPLHDIGKIAIPDAVLLKPGRLTPEEMSVMRTHAEIGARLLSGGSSDLMVLAEQIALSHHERWDGEGYPRRLRQDETPAAARIVALADVVDALSHDRPYRPAWSHDEVIHEVESNRGRHFDPQAVDACLAILTSGDGWSSWDDEGVRNSTPGFGPPEISAKGS